MNVIQALAYAVLQGVTELFPVSSLGHGVVVPALFGWGFDRHDPYFLPFLTFLHFGTLVALLVVFWRDWWSLLHGASGRDGAQRQIESLRILFLLVVATIPAVMIGGLFEHYFCRIFADPRLVSLFLVANGVLLLAMEGLRARQRLQKRETISALGVKDALFIGVWQCLALLPGLSRSGSTIIGGLLRGLNHEVATRFSLLMAQPIVFAATVKEGFALRHIKVTHEMAKLSVIAAVAAGVTALLSTLFLLRYFRKHDGWALAPFAYYCVIFGSVGYFILAR